MDPGMKKSVAKMYIKDKMIGPITEFSRNHSKKLVSIIFTVSKNKITSIRTAISTHMMIALIVQYYQPLLCFYSEAGDS